MPVYTWEYKDDPGHTPHLGPMAQDFYAAFRLGPENTSINALDGIGVAVAGVKGNYEINKDQGQQIQELQQELEDLRVKNQELENRVQRLEQAVKLIGRGIRR